MKLITNLDIPTKMQFTEVEELPNLTSEGFLAKAGQAVEFEYVEGLGYESEEIKYLAADPVIDGLALFRHPDAPWSMYAESEAKEIYEKWNQLVEEDDFSGNIAAEGMVGTTFQVFCWKAFDSLQAGEVYEATIENFFGFNTDGFVIYNNDQEVVVDMVDQAINHFVLV